MHGVVAMGCWWRVCDNAWHLVLVPLRCVSGDLLVAVFASD